MGEVASLGVSAIVVIFASGLSGLARVLDGLRGLVIGLRASSGSVVWGARE